MASVSIRYARAFTDVVMESKLDGPAVLAQLQSLLAAYAESSDLRRVWDAPSIPAEQKHAVLDALLKKMGPAPRQLRNFIAVLIDHGRVRQLPEIAEQFENEWNQRMGRVRAEVTSTRPLSEKEKAELAARLTAMTGKQVAATYNVDKKLLGGAVVRVGSTVYDGSVRGQLQRIKQQLSAG